MVPTGVALIEIVEELKKSCKVVEIIVEYVVSTEGESYSVHFSVNSRYSMYGEFESLEKAMDLSDAIVIRGRKSDWIMLPHSTVEFANRLGIMTRVTTEQHWKEKSVARGKDC
ncbi:unnamed protein product [Blepharisma stoltei]|uniref:Uncharacterized protein n=1 Tax=Blepharisma stoltei TaxID=1481888 RepID=A0AAU9JDY0_9CILI|nr:unnamed protein product [Blepharisma stoltei]